MENWLYSEESQHKKLLEDLHLVLFSVFAALEKEHVIIYKHNNIMIFSVTYTHRCSSHSLELPVVYLQDLSFLLQ